ncbi:hypothetical protein ASG79_14260 [Arthrobacter sp. Soil761]|nr:hypothetical protein ASG79_14260 [Arthrobacter sp. Soil761]
MVLSGCAGPSPEGARDGENRTLRIAVNAAPRSLDPAQLDGGVQSYIWGSVYDTLLYYDNAGKLQPNAAESWEVSDDALTVTFNLRQGMTFSNGNAVTAEAVAATLERNKETPGQQQSKMAAVKSVDIADEYRVAVHLSSPDPSFIYNMALDAGVIADPATVNEPRSATAPVGSGPYELDMSASVSGSSYVLQKRKEYWNADAYPFQSLTVRILPDQTAALNALRSGEIDVSTVPANQLSTFSANDFNIVHTPSSSVGYLDLADRDGKVLSPLGDIRVRKAINYALNRKEIVNKLLSGGAQPSNQQFNLKGEAYDSQLEDVYPYDPDQARKLLSEAGYAGGFDVSMPSTPLSTTFEPTISQALSDVGIRVTWVPVPPQNATRAVAAGEYPMYFFVVGTDVMPREVQRQLHSASQNPFNWSSPELQRLESEANKELDPQERANKYKELNRYVVENALFAPLFFLGKDLVTSKNVKYLGDGTNNFSSIRAFDVS